VIAAHPEREKISSDLLRGVPVRVVCKKFGISKDVCYRFLQSVPPAVKAKRYADSLRPGANVDKLREEESEGLLVGLHTQRVRLLQMQDMAMELADPEMVARLSGQIHVNLQLVGKYLGEFVNRSRVEVVSLALTPGYLQLRSALVESMANHPEARHDILKALREVEAIPAVAGHDKHHTLDAKPVIEAAQ